MPTIEVKGVPELKKTFLQLSALAAAQGADTSIAQATVRAGYRDAGRIMESSVRAMMAGRSWPAILLSQSLFSDARPADNLPKGKQGVLVGLRTGAPPRLDRDIFRQWRSRGAVRTDTARLKRFVRRQRG